MVPNDAQQRKGFELDRDIVSQAMGIRGEDHKMLAAEVIYAVYQYYEYEQINELGGRIWKAINPELDELSQNFKLVSSSTRAPKGLTRFVPSRLRHRKDRLIRKAR